MLWDGLGFFCIMFLYYSVTHIWIFKMFFFPMLKVCVALFFFFFLNHLPPYSSDVNSRSSLRWNKLKPHRDIFSAYMQCAFFPLKLHLFKKTKQKTTTKKKNNTAAPLWICIVIKALFSLQCVTVSFYSTTKTSTHPFSITASPARRVLGGEASKTGWCLKIMQK